MSRTLGAFILVMGFSMGMPTNAGNPQSGDDKLRGTELPHGADLILLHGKIWTGEPVAARGETPAPARIVQAVAIANGRILAVGSDEEIRTCKGLNTVVVDLRGRLVVPGLADSHVHFIQGGFQLLEVDLKDAPSEEVFVRRIADKASTLPPGRWMRGGNWDEEAWPSEKLPDRWLIDPVTLHTPVFISRYDGHAGLANSLALKLAGVTKNTRDPAGGVIVRDPKSGEPTGILKDRAQDLVAKVIPRPTESEMEEALRTALKEAARVGLTSVHDITVDTDSWNGSFTGEIRLLRRAELEGWLTCRLYAITPIAQWEKLAEAGISHDMGSDFLKLGAVKAFADGSLGSRTGWMFKPYDDDPGNVGLPMPLMIPPSKMEGLARQADNAGIQICTHAIGDRATSAILNIYERLGGDHPAAHRFRVEHAQHVRREDFARFGKLGVVASMQPYHAIDDGRWAEKRIGHERARTSYAWRSMLDAGAVLAFGSDWPVAPLDPLSGIAAAVTRATLDGKNPGGWFPEQRLTVEEALRAYTQGCAYAAFEEKDKGTIWPGKFADLDVLSEDLFRIPPARIKDARVEMTIVGGRVVYQAGNR
ncbi:MAG: amidohydrolase [Terriglobia bacterium]|jgi:predicted amidohydrolase YtcJ